MSQIKILQIRDSGTFIPIVALKLDPFASGNDQEFKLFRSVGHAEPVYLMFDLGQVEDVKAFSSQKTWSYEPMSTHGASLQELINNWDNYQNGDIIQAGVLTGRVKEPQESNV
jgi:hypothetical protein